jgi:hypothetical protein
METLDSNYNEIEIPSVRLLDVIDSLQYLTLQNRSTESWHLVFDGFYYRFATKSTVDTTR